MTDETIQLLVYGWLGITGLIFVVERAFWTPRYFNHRFDSLDALLGAMLWPLFVMVVIMVAVMYVLEHIIAQFKR